MNEVGDFIAIALSATSLIVSALTLFLSYFRRPALSPHVGPYITVIYNNKGLALTVPTTVANQSHRIGVVRRCSLTLTRHDRPQENFFMVWDSFRKITDDGATWVQSGTAHAIPVLGRATQTQNIQYIWENATRPIFEIEATNYKLQFDFWSEEQTPFATITHDLSVSAVDAARIKSTQQQNTTAPIRTGLVYLTLDSETNKNRVMTQHEKRRLL